MQNMKRIEHIGIAVQDLAEAEKVFEDILGHPPFKRERVDSEAVEVSFFETGESKVELLATTEPEGPIGQHIQKRGPGLHHLAFHVDDLHEEIARLETMGYKIIGGPKSGADGKIIAFLHPSDTVKVLVELCDDAP